MKSIKGFTLVELLGVIILIGVLMIAISSPIISLINSNSKKLDEASSKLLYTAAEQFMNKDSRTYVKTNGNIYYISLEQLIHNDFLEEKFLESYSEEVLSKYTQIKVTVKNNSYTFEIPNMQLNNIAQICNELNISNTYNYNGGTYLKGNYSNNYVLYNGLMFRIMGVNSDGTIRLIMDEVATSLSYADSTLNYSDSYIRKWLNDYFISRLQHSSIIAKQKWFFKSPGSLANTQIDLNLNVEDKVGVLSLEEFNLSLNSNQSYLIKDKTYGFININGSLISNKATNNMPASQNTTGEFFVYPIINVLSSSVITSGNGTSLSPYVLAEMLTNRSSQTLEEANLSIGSYLLIDSKLYRVIEKGNDEIKVMSYHNTGLSSKYADTNNTFNLYNGVGKLLNSNIISTKFLNKNIFLGDIYNSGHSYKTTVFVKKNLVNNVYSSLPIMGEMLTGPLYNVASKPDCYWSLNLSSSTLAYQICNNSIRTTNINDYNSNSSNSYGVIFTSYIDISNVITSGKGTINEPYQI